MQSLVINITVIHIVMYMEVCEVEKMCLNVSECV